MIHDNFLKFKENLCKMRLFLKKFFGKQGEIHNVCDFQKSQGKNP